MAQRSRTAGVDGRSSGHVGGNGTRRRHDWLEGRNVPWDAGLSQRSRRDTPLWVSDPVRPRPGGCQARPHRRAPDRWRFLERVHEVRYVDITFLSGSAPLGST